MKSDCRVVKTTAILTKLRKGFSHSQILAKDLWGTQEFKKHEQLDTFCNLASTLHSASGCSWNSAPVSPVIFWQDGPLRQRISSSIDGRNRSRSPPPKAGMDSTTLQRIRSVSSKFLQSPWTSEQDRPWSQERTVLKTSKRLQTVTRATKFAEQFFQPIWWFLQSAGISGAVAQFSISSQVLVTVSDEVEVLDDWCSMRDQMCWPTKIGVESHATSQKEARMKQLPVLLKYTR